MSINIQDLVDAGVFPDTDAVMREALRVLWQESDRARNLNAFGGKINWMILSEPVYLRHDYHDARCAGIDQVMS